MSKKITLLAKHKLSKDEYHVSLEYDGKVYSDNFSLPGLKKLVKENKDKSSRAYIVQAAMLEAVMPSKPKEEN